MIRKIKFISILMSLVLFIQLLTSAGNASNEEQKKSENIKNLTVNSKKADSDSTGNEIADNKRIIVKYKDSIKSKSIMLI